MGTTIIKRITLKEEATNLREKGYSYNMISEKLGLSKSTLSDWLKEIPFSPNKEVLKRVKMGQMKSAISKQNKRIAQIKEKKEEAKIEIGRLSIRDLLILGVGIYLGEGTKLNESIRIINSDPDIIRLSVWWFREICKLKNENINPCVHIYPDIDQKQAESYWSKIIGVPVSNFGKTQIDKRIGKSGKKNRKLLFGTVHLYIKSNGNKEFGRSLHRKIMGWITAINDQLPKIH
ncbi:hypothetical protein COY62_00860 [bacterium (Candidatus Howlettbacteria) CG_4_10_14_0_8_um_filter_40_9]|nr:MAG: hypothetical protein COY62_00860 [bacterium (Candidatus Howlettbacteria) CG_4_10_14_0_8_um_filter_40_9]